MRAQSLIVVSTALLALVGCEQSPLIGKWRFDTCAYVFHGGMQIGEVAQQARCEVYAKEFAALHFDDETAMLAGKPFAVGTYGTSIDKTANARVLTVDLKDASGGRRTLNFLETGKTEIELFIDLPESKEHEFKLIFRRNEK